MSIKDAQIRYDAQVPEYEIHPDIVLNPGDIVEAIWTHGRREMWELFRVIAIDEGEVIGRWESGEDMGDVGVVADCSVYFRRVV